MPKKVTILLCLCALLLASPAHGQITWRLEDGGFSAGELSTPVTLNHPLAQADLDGDGQAEHFSISAGGQVQLMSGTMVRWISPDVWNVKQAQFADLNRDGLPELVMLVWRPFEPWPVDKWLPQGGRIQNFHDAQGMSCHLILLGWFQGIFRERWAGSALAEPILAFAVQGSGGSRRQSLITLESSYDAQDHPVTGRLKLWEWNSFGFSVVHKENEDIPLPFILQDKSGETFVFGH